MIIKTIKEQLRQPNNELKNYSLHNRINFKAYLACVRGDKTNVFLANY